MSANPIEAVEIDGTPAEKSVFRSWGKARIAQVMANATEVNNTDLTGQLAVHLKSNGRHFALDTLDTTTPDDGINCIVDLANNRFKLSSTVGVDGADGADGANGTDPGIRWKFDSSISMADPGSGDLRLNNAALASVTAIAISANTAETGNPSAANFVKTWDDSTTLTHRGLLIIKKPSAPQNFAVYDVTAAHADNTTWLQVTVAHVVSNGSFTNTDVLSVQFYRTGDKGTDGTTVVAAAQADQETATSTSLFVNPGVQQYHPSAAKAFARWNNAGTIDASYNVSLITDNGTGNWTVNFTTAFSAGSYVGMFLGSNASNAYRIPGQASDNPPTASAFRVYLRDTSSLIDAQGSEKTEHRRAKARTQGRDRASCNRNSAGAGRS